MDREREQIPSPANQATQKVSLGGEQEVGGDVSIIFRNRDGSRRREVHVDVPFKRTCLSADRQ